MESVWAGNSTNQKKACGDGGGVGGLVGGDQ